MFVTITQRAVRPRHSFIAIDQQLLHIRQHLRVLLDLGLITSATLRRVTHTAKPLISVSKLLKFEMPPKAPLTVEQFSLSQPKKKAYLLATHGEQALLYSHEQRTCFAHLP